jgi:hypothetical protein
MGIFSGLGSLVGGIANQFGAAGEGGMDTRKQAAEIFAQLQQSNFDYRSLSPPQLRVLGELEPQLYDAIVPPEARMVQDSAEGRAGQLQAVQGLGEIAAGGMPLVDRLAAERSAREVQDASRAANEDVLRQMAARGDLGAGDELQARMQANQYSQNAGADLAAQNAEMAALRRLAATGQLGQTAGALRAGDVAVSGKNADIINRFNELFLQNKQQQARDAAMERARVQAANVGRAQDVGDFNAQARYGTERDNLTRQNDLRGRSFDQSLSTRAYGQSGALQGLANAQDAEQRARAEGIVGMGRGVGQIGDSIYGYASGRDEFLGGDDSGFKF